MTVKVVGVGAQGKEHKRVFTSWPLFVASGILLISLGLGLGLGLGLSRNSSTANTYQEITVVNGGDSSLSIIDTSSDTVTRTVKLTNVTFPHHASISPAMTKIVIGVPGVDLSNGHGNISSEMSGMFIVLDSTTYITLKTVQLPHMNHNAAYSPDGSEIWTGQMVMNGTVLVYDSTTYLLKHTIAVGMMPLEVSFSKDGTMAFVCNGVMNGTVVMIDVRSKSIMQSNTVGDDPVGAWPGVNNVMYVDNEMSQSITMINATTMSNMGTINLTFTPGMAAYNKADSTIWVTDGTNGKVVVFNSDGFEKSTISTGAGSHGIQFNSDFSKVYITNQGEKTVSVINSSLKSKIKDIVVGVKPNGMAMKL